MRTSPPLSPSKHADESTIGSFETTILKKDMNIGLRLEKLFEESFRVWGVFVASNPIKVMVSSLIVSIILAFGMCWWNVTTDPVDLWVSSTSQARQDMEYFNQHFWKFYRIEQVVIAPSNGSTFEADGESFGPAFNKEFMLKVFQLQKSIEAITVPGSDGTLITLDSICFKPLDKDCATQSVFTYFLDNKTYIERDDYTSRISTCTRLVFLLSLSLSLLSSFPRHSFLLFGPFLHLAY